MNEAQKRRINHIIILGIGIVLGMMISTVLHYYGLAPLQ